MSGWSRSDVIGLGSLVIGLGSLIVAIIVALADSDVRCFLRLQSESCPSPQITQTSPSESNQNDEKPKSSSSPPISIIELPPSTTVEPDTNSDPDLISKSTGVDYNPLRNLLVEGKWKDADRETARTMLTAAGREKEGWLRTEDIDSFSCDDLRLIDQLWLESSQGKFGFSVQKDIYEGLGGTREYNQEVWESFGDRIGWRKGGNWLYYDEHTFNLNAPQAHLPKVRFFGRIGLDWLVGLVGGLDLDVEGVRDIFSRAANCNL